MPRSSASPAAPVSIVDEAQESAASGEETPARGRLLVAVPPIIHSAAVELDDEAGVRRLAGTLGESVDSPAALVKLALLLGHARRDDWIVHGDRLYTFAPPDQIDDFRAVTRPGSVERSPTGGTAHADMPDADTVMLPLLHRTLQHRLKAQAVEWHANGEVFRFLPLKEGDRMRHERWTDRHPLAQTVYVGRRNEKGCPHESRHAHLAFSTRFERTDALWHCHLEARWLYTVDLYTESADDPSLPPRCPPPEARSSARLLIAFLAHFLADDASPPDRSVKFGDLDMLLAPASTSTDGTSDAPEGVLPDRY